jgi:dTDP-4-amino-4,6-dideoxygalactose transaminase
MAGWFLRGDLPPVGNRVLLRADLPPPQFPGYSFHGLNSGTAALALALIVARTRQPTIREPKVLLPAYGCPDLVAAAEFAKLQPVLVDVGQEDPGYSLDSLERALTPETVAVVAVNFLGISERLAEIRRLLERFPQTALIEDDAQWLPAATDRRQPMGDLVCFSFGRGKPLSLLGGGALLVRDDGDVRIPAGAIDPAEEPGPSFAVKTLLFNTLLRRHVYWIVNRNPLIRVGQTAFKPLTQISALDKTRSCYLGPNVAAYSARSRAIESSWSQALAQLKTVKPLPVEEERKGRLLRYPVLCRSLVERDELLLRLRRAGLGATAMYQRPLAQVTGVEGKVRIFEGSEGARAFAERLLTLPVHEQVTQNDVRRAAEVLAGF